MAGYIGSIPVPQATQNRETFTATASQTSFATGGHQSGYLDVFMNGVKLVDGSDYTATNGSDVVLATGAAVNDIIEVVSYSAFEVLNQNFTGTTVVDDLTVGGNVTFGDNNKAIFGGELEIYSDATHARIREFGSGQLKIQGDNMQLLTTDGASTYLEGTASTGAVTLYHASNAPRVATTSFGAQITGSLAVDTITNASSSTDVTIDTNFDIILDAGGNVGIGDTSPSRALSTKSASVTVGSFESTSASGGLISFVDPNTTNDVTVRIGSLGNNLVLQAGGNTAATIDSSGNLSIGSSDDNPFSFGGSSNNVSITASGANDWALLSLKGNGTGATAISLGAGSVRQAGIFSSPDSHLDFGTNPTNSGTSLTTRMRIASDGAVTMPYQPAFGVINNTAGQNNISPGSDHTVVFGGEIFDQGNDFASNTFTAPVSGRYQFNVHIRLYQVDTAATYYQAQLATSNHNYEVGLVSPKFTSDPEYVILSGSILADMDASDTAYVRVYQHQGSAQTDLQQSTSTFSGYLVA
jgi:hypothetical protein